MRTRDPGLARDHWGDRKVTAYRRFCLDMAAKVEPMIGSSTSFVSGSCIGMIPVSSSTVATQPAAGLNAD
jgi:hypothetical protein